MKTRNRITFLVIALLCLLPNTSCGNTTEDMFYSGQTVSYDIQISDTEYVTVQVPIEVQLTLTDNHTHYEFSDGTVIDLVNSQVTTAKLDEETGIYVSNNSLQLNIDDKCILVSCTGTMQEAMKSYLQNIHRSKVSTDLYKEQRIDYLPDYVYVDMELVDNMYMPIDTPKYDWLSYESQLYTEGTAWLQLTVYDYPLTDIKSRLLTSILCNTGAKVVDEWYQDDNILYARAGTHCIVTKRLAYNCTYVYMCDQSLLNYALQGVHKVHGTITYLED